MKLPAFTLALIFALFSGAAKVSAEPQFIYHYQNDERHQYQIELLQHVLTLTRKEYGEAVLKHKALPTHRAGLWALSTGEVDIACATSTQKNVSTFLPIKVPILQGLLGYRPLLTTTGRAHIFERIHTLDDLKKYAVTAFGRHWDSLAIITANGLSHITRTHYHELFELVAKEQVDYMPRGLSEVYPELATHRQQYPNLVLSHEVALHIPMAYYYYVNTNNKRLAERIYKGLDLAMEDGSFKRIFDEHFKEAIEKAMKMRVRVITLHNPLLPDDMPKVRVDWWVPEHLSDIISSTPGAPQKD